MNFSPFLQNFLSCLLVNWIFNFHWSLNVINLHQSMKKLNLLWISIFQFIGPTKCYNLCYFNKKKHFTWKQKTCPNPRASKFNTNPNKMYYYKPWWSNNWTVSKTSLNILHLCLEIFYWIMIQVAGTGHRYHYFISEF